ncbi:MAG: YceI family protein [Chloroflexota bacterium]
MPNTRIHRRAAFSTALIALTTIACGPAAPTATAPAASTPSPGASRTPAAGTAAVASPTAAAQVPAGAIRFQVVPNESTATFRVREQLAGVDLPGDAVGSTGAVTGQLTLQPTGAVVQDASKITVDLRELKTDESRRDNYIKSNTLATSRFPTAEFVPARATGLPSPLPASGEHTFQLTGLMTIHGVQKEITWDVTATREGNRLAGTATTSFKFGDFGMTPPRVPVVLSVTDEIRLEVDLVATQAA